MVPDGLPTIPVFPEPAGFDLMDRGPEKLDTIPDPIIKTIIV
jgi:hypothetical protein